MSQDNQISNLEGQFIDQIFDQIYEFNPPNNMSICALDQLLIDNDTLSQFQCSIGALNTYPSDYLLEDSDESSQGTESSTSEELIFHYENEEELDEFMSAVIAGKSTGVTPEHLSKVWQIDILTAKKTLAVTSQNNKGVGNEMCKWILEANDQVVP